MYDEIRHCISCGKEFKPYRHDQATCGDKKCVKKSVLVRCKKYRQESKIRTEMKKRKGNNSVMDIANRAREEGLSYGQYVAKYGL